MEFEKLVSVLKNQKLTISSMESCTGGLFASEITNIEGSSDVLKCSLVTYSNDFKIKFGVSSEVIKEYTVYSNQTSMEMAKKVSSFTESNIGIGITGQLGRYDPANPGKKTDEVFYTIYQKDSDIYYNDKIQLKKTLTRKEKKQRVVKQIAKELLNILK